MQRLHLLFFLAIILVLPVLLPGIIHAQVTNSVFNDSLASGWADDWIWNDLTINHAVTNPVYSGTKSMSFSVGGAQWSAWNGLYAAGFDTNPYLYFQFAAQETKPGVPWEVSFLDASGNRLGTTYFEFSPPVGSWQQYTLNLSQYGAAYQKIYGIRFWHVTAAAPANTIYVDAMGFGGISVTPTPSPTPAPATAQLSVDATVSVNPFDKKMLGMAMVNWEFSWGKTLPGQVPGLAQAMKAVHSGLIRYAGGLWANWVGWDRTKLDNNGNGTSWTKNGQTYSYNYGTNEIDSLATLAQAVGSDVMIQVNVSNNDPAMWADMVKYTNIDHNYHFKYWEMGNELDLECSNGASDCVTPANYQTRVQAYATAMKAVDPSIQIVGGVPAAAHDYYTSGNWTGASISQYLTQAAPVSDALSWHWYEQCNKPNLSDMYTYSFPGTDPGSAGSAYSRSWSKNAPANIQTQIINPGKPNQQQGVSELNYDACDFSQAPQNTNHANALWAADVLGRLAYNGLDFVTWYTGYGSPTQYALIYKTPDQDQPTGIKVRPTYYTFFMYANYFGDQLVKSVSDDESKVSMWAAKDSQDPSKLALMVTNLTPSTVTAPITLTGFTPTSGSVYKMTSANPTDFSAASSTDHATTTINGGVLDPMNVTASAATNIQPISLAVNSGNFTYVFPPYSLTAIVLHGSGSTSVIDSNADGKVNALDFGKVILNLGWTGAAGTNISDVNNDGKVDTADLTAVLSAWLQ